MTIDKKVKAVVNRFNICGELAGIAQVRRGHINDTYIVACDDNGLAVRYVLQRINHTVFKDPPSMMANIARVTEHICRKMQAIDPDLAARQLALISTDEGKSYCQDFDGNFWRMYNFIDNAVTYDRLESAERAREAARMFGWFQRMLTDLPGPPLHETIPDFHNTPKRFDAFRDVLRADILNRAKDVKCEIDFLFENSDICNVLVDLADKGDVPVRIVHNDTKINNIMLDEETDRGICVIDLDTVMPGLSVYDFGDMIRTAANSAAEDERDLSKVAVDISMFKALVRGFAAETGGFLTVVEREHLVTAAKIITFEQFIRFLTDYLAGDVYYKIDRQEHNLDRSRTQMELVRSIVGQEEAMNTLVEKVFRENLA